MKNSKKAWVIFRRFLLILFIFFLINYSNAKNNRYSSSIREQTILTNEKLKEFENDVQNGEYIDIKDYQATIPDSSSFTSNIGYEVGLKIDDFFNKKVSHFFNYIASFFK